MKVCNKTNIVVSNIIEIETKEEAKLLWHIINCPINVCFSDYCETNGIHDITMGMLIDLRDDLANIYIPENKPQC